MKLIIPLAGKGTRLRPHTWSKPKPLVHVAGKPVLGHLIDQYKKLDIEELVFVTGDMDDQIKSYIEKEYSGYKSSYVKQQELLGDGHALMMTKNIVADDVIINFNDTLFETDLGLIKHSKAQGIIWVSETDDPKRFGIITEKDGRITDIEEKPEHPKSNLAIIGLYYFRDAKLMFKYLQKVIDMKLTSKGELRLADAMALMIKDGVHLETLRVKRWLDTGKPETLLETNKYLLEHGCANINGHGADNRIIPPVFIEEGAKVHDSIIGPNVSIAKGAEIYRCSIENSVIGRDSHLRYKKITHSLIGEKTIVSEKPKVMNIGDNSEMIEH